MSFSRQFLSSIALIFILAGCQTSDPAPADAPKLGLGESQETAVAIGKGHTEFTGIRAEHDWINQNYPGWKIRSQALAGDGGRYFDILTISKAGQTKDIWFDITGFFGVL